MSEANRQCGSQPDAQQSQTQSKYPLDIKFRHDPHSDDPWNAYREAVSYCERRGWSVGSMQRGAPIAVFEGDYDVSKWRNLSVEEQRAALATITSTDGGNFRDADVVLWIAREAEVSA